MQSKHKKSSCTHNLTEQCDFTEEAFVSATFLATPWPCDICGKFESNCREDKSMCCTVPEHEFTNANFIYSDSQWPCDNCDKIKKVKKEAVEAELTEKFRIKINSMKESGGHWRTLDFPIVQEDIVKRIASANRLLYREVAGYTIKHYTRYRKWLWIRKLLNLPQTEKGKETFGRGDNAFNKRDIDYKLVGWISGVIALTQKDMGYFW